MKLLQESIIIVCEDRILHTELTPFCTDPNCPCRSDVEATNTITGFVMDGLLSWHEANLILRGEYEYRRAS